MFKLSNFQAAMESNSWMEDGADVTVEQTIEVEVAADEETQETVEVEETIDDTEEVAEETEEMLATLEYAAHAQMVVEEFGWSRPVATMLNAGQNHGSKGDIEQFLGLSLPSNESLDMVSSSYDNTTVAVLESFSDKAKQAWEWIKKQARKIWSFIVNLVRRIGEFFFKLDTTAKRYADAIKKASFDKEKLDKREFKLVSSTKFDALMLKGGVAKSLLPGFDKMTGSIGAIAFDADTKNADTAKSEVKNSFTPLLESLSGVDGITVDKDKGTITVSSEFSKNLKAETMTLTKSGWTASDLSNTSTVVVLYNIAKSLPKASKAAESIMKKIESAANRASKKYTDEEDKKNASRIKETATVGLTAMKEVSKACNIISNLAFSMIRAFISAQRAMLACRS